MNTDRVIDEMSSWLESNYPEISCERIVGDTLTTMHDIEYGSYEQAKHLKWMIREMRAMDDREKLMRWIGFMQGALWSLGFASIDNFREMNKVEK